MSIIARKTHLFNSLSTTEGPYLVGLLTRTIYYEEHQHEHEQTSATLSSIVHYAPLDNQMETKIRPVILAGGSGTRLWPLSRVKNPKQFIPFINGRSLFQETCLRFSDMELFTAPLIVTHEEYIKTVQEQLEELGIISAEIIIEPTARNTAPACLVSALYLEKHEGSVPMIITPADHLTSNDEDLMHSIREASAHVHTGKIGVFGIRPTHPNPGFGYIIRGNKLSDRTSHLSLFIEKPPKEKAEELISEHDALWNSGLYFMTNETLIQEASLHAKEMLELSKEIVRGLEKKENLGYIDGTLYDQIESISIDKAISEKSDKLVVIETFIGWTDLGSWSSVHKEFEKDENGTIRRGDVIAINTENSYLESTHRLVTVYGLNDIAVIETKDAVAVFPLSESDNVKLIVQELDRNKREETIS